MSNADDRCAYSWNDGQGTCYTPRWAHKGRIMHAFVETAPQLAPSGDEAKVRELGRWSKHLPCTGCMVCDAYAAGKADGAREEREACEKLGRDVETHYERQILVEQQSGAYQGEVVATAKREIGKRIADAIARRGSEGK